MARNDEREATDDMACPRCAGVVETIGHPTVYRFGEGASAVALDVVLPVRCCRACGFEYLDHDAERIKHEALRRRFGVLTPGDIRAGRKRRGLGREAFAERVGLDAETVARWEAGIAIQSLADDRLLRLAAMSGAQTAAEGAAHD